MKYIIITTTFDNVSEAKQMADELLNKKLIACAQISKINSIYVWKAEKCNSDEFLLTIKTINKNYKTIENFIKNNHSYECAEILSYKVLNGSRQYLNWINESLQ